MYAIAITLVVCSQVDLTPDDLAAIFFENAHRAQTLRVQSSVVTKDMNERLALSLEMIRLFQQELRSGHPPAEMRAKFEKEIAGHQQIVKELTSPQMPAPVQTRQDFWTDRSNFQARSPIDSAYNTPSSYGSPPSARFPDVEATRDNLSRVFKNICVLSYGPATHLRFRSWDAYEVQPGYHSAGARSQNPNPHCYFPPLALWHTE